MEELVYHLMIADVQVDGQVPIVQHVSVIIKFSVIC